jgi:serine protease Do
MRMRNLKHYTAALMGLWLMGLTAMARADLPDFTGLVEAASPAVVNISTRQKIPEGRGAGAMTMPDLEGLPPGIREFFERSIPQMPRSPRGKQEQAQSLGSGFIISADGYILTNNHVVADADEILVRLSDRSDHTAKLIGADPRTDVALLKIDAKDLPTLKLGSSDQLKVGEWVLAGIVSAKGRSLPNESYVPFIQTDVAINPGNSGGPLFNLKGEVVGINSQIFTRSGGFMGLSFAIPIDVAMNVANQLKTEGKVSRGWLGVVIQEVDKDLAESFGLDRPAGALVAQILDDGPAAKSGIKVGDVILSVNGQKIEESADLPHLIGNLKPGAKADMEVIREGKRQNLSVTVGDMPKDDQATSGGERGSDRASNRLGIAVANLTAEQKKTMDIQSGVVINKLSGDGPAAAIGLRPGDVITHLNNQPIESATAFEKITSALPAGRSISMRVVREGRASFITFKLPGK